MIGPPPRRSAFVVRIRYAMDEGVFHLSDSASQHVLGIQSENGVDVEGAFDAGVAVLGPGFLAYFRDNSD